MKILNVCLTGPFSDGYNYQDNLLSKYQRIIGNDVYLIAPRWIWNHKGKLEIINNDNYINSDGVHIIRLHMKYIENINNIFKTYHGLSENLSTIKPDIIFIHGCQFLDIKKIAKYAQTNKVKVFVDNHADFSNSAKNWLTKNILHKIIWKHYAKIIEPYTEKFYGVLPARVDFLVGLYDIPQNKVDLLIMGANDIYIDKYCKADISKKIRQSIDINDNDFLIVTGGKIDYFKKQTLLLMETMKRMPNNVKLIIFGSVEKKLKKKFDELCKNKNIKYLGWINEEESYKYFSIADLVIFPGRHSVYWEQVVAIGIPMICKYWKGTTHIDIGGNVEFIYSDDQMEETVLDVINNKNKYAIMKKNANKATKNKFLYSEIAKKSIGK